MHKAIRNVRNLLLLTAACLYFDAGQTSILASPPLCETVCTGAVACNETCYETMLDFDTDNPTTCGAMEVSCCGDDLCNGDTEEVDSCEVDCGDPVSSPPDCNPHTQSGCAAGEMCTYLGKCVDANGPPMPSPPPACFVVACSTQADCCFGNFCYRLSGWASGVCIPPQ